MNIRRIETKCGTTWKQRIGLREGARLDNGLQLIQIAKDGFNRLAVPNCVIRALLTMEKPMITHFADYRWSNGKPSGISPIEYPAGKEHFRLLGDGKGVRLEQFDGSGKFLRLVYCPQDEDLAGTTYVTSDDHLHKVRRAANGVVRSYEEYAWPNGIYADDVYPEVKIFNAHGRLVWRHRPERVSESAWDIHVLDILEKTRVVLHHTGVGLSEPCTIEEEWVK